MIKEKTVRLIVGEPRGNKQVWGPVQQYWELIIYHYNNLNYREREKKKEWDGDIKLEDFLI